MILLRNARIVLPDRVVEPANLLVQNDRIARIADSLSNDTIEADSVINLQGFTLYPGFIDVHIHGAVGVDTTEANANDLDRVGEHLARNGVTAWLPTLVPARPEQYQQAVDSIEGAMQTKGKVALVLGVHYEGPFVNSEQCGALHKEYFRTFNSRAALDELPTLPHQQAVHMMTLAPEVEGGIDLIKELASRSWIASIGHTRATAAILDQALAAGARHMTHFMNAMTPLHHRHVGAVGWGLIHDDVTCDIIADGIHIDRSILKLIVSSKNSGKVSLISDAIAAAGMGDGDYEIWGEKISVTHGRTQNARGSIAGSVINMFDAVRMMLSLGFSEPEVARMASLNPVKLIGLDQDRGSIEEGKRADLVAIDNEMNVRLTIIGGEVAFQDSL
jgi:N-acetylglucosamine-6-phosphate deacetylase